MMKKGLYLEFTSESFVINILKSGWSNPQIYHVIYEDGEIGDSSHVLLTAKEIFEKHSIDIDKEFKKIDRIKKLESL